MAAFGRLKKDMIFLISCPKSVGKKKRQKTVYSADLVKVECPKAL